MKKIVGQEFYHKIQNIVSLVIGEEKLKTDRQIWPTSRITWLGKNSAPSDNDKGSIRPVNRRGQTPKRTETAIRPSKSRNLAGPSTENSFQSTRLLLGYKNLVKNK